MASFSDSNSNSNIIGQWTYDAFLSFAGKDTRRGFVGHLYRALDERGIYTFKDDLKLHMGDSISNELLDAIEASRFAVVVFSEKYAASSWCLDELVKIIECKKKFGQTVIPVFYNVDPFIIRRQRGVFEEAFRKHEDRFRNDLQKVQMWRETLAEAAGLSGLDVSNTENGNEAECILKIVQEVSSKCKESMTVAKNLIGVESRVQDVKTLLCISTDDVRFLGIWGAGGVGKTTLAWAVYSEISNNFQGRSYVANVREVSKHSGLQVMQQKVLSEILSDASMKVNNDREGIELMGRRLKRKSVLLVLDDVDDVDQLAALAGDHDWFGKGSRIIITTRDKHLLSKVNAIYNATLLNHLEAIQLFSLYAFGKSELLKEYEEYSHEIVHYANGLPLALKVLGSFLFKRGMDEWKSALSKLKAAPHGKIHEVLKISFDRLSLIEQKIFLDIACFFKGKKKDRVVRILDSFGFFGDIGIRVLVEKSLISVSNKRLDMHDLIQEMGWHIVREVSDEPGRRSRLWLHTDVSHVFTSYSGTSAIEGVSLESAVEVDSGLSLTKSFRNMNELRFLQLDIVHFNPIKLISIPKVAKYLWDKFQSTDKLMYLPNNLRWLTWGYYPFNALPESFEAEKLVGLELPTSEIARLWKGRKRMDSLRYIDLGSSYALKSTPDLTWTPNLQTLILDNCWNLVNVHPSLADHGQLVFLSFRRCEELKSLPSPLQMTSLENFDLTYCLKLKSFPEIVSGKMEKLIKLRLESASVLKVLPPSIQNLSGLVLLKLRYCESLTSLPSTICSLKSLKTLDVSHCIKLEKLPENLGQLQSLEELFMRRTPIQEAPSSIVLLKNLKTVSVGRSQELATSLLLSGRKYSNSSYFGLELPPLLQFSSLETLKTLLLDNCSLSEKDIPGDLSPLCSLEELDLSHNQFKHLPSSICQLPRLKILDICWCKDLQELQVLPSSIVVLHLSYRGAAKSLPDLMLKYGSLCKVTLLDDTDFIDAELPDSVMQSLLQGPLVANHRLSITFMGNRIPEWFSNQSPGNQMYLQLSSNWSNKSLLGFAISAVFEEFKDFPLFISSIKFDLIEEEMNNMDTIGSRASPCGRGCNYMWLGFFSVSFFQLLLPDLKPDDWSTFQGCLRASFRSYPSQQCAMRLVYVEDMIKGSMPMIQNSLVLNDPMGRPWIKHNPDASNNDGDDSDEEENDFTCSRINLSSSTTVYLKERGRRHAEIGFQL